MKKNLNKGKIINITEKEEYGKIREIRLAMEKGETRESKGEKRCWTDREN